MNKHYCFFSAQYLPSVGGVERYTYCVACKLIEKGNKVTIVTSQINETLSYEKTAEGIEIYRLPAYNLLNGRYPVVKKNALFKKYVSELKEKHFDYVIVNTRFYLLSLFGVKFAKKNGIPSIVIEHGSAHLTVNNKMLDTVGEMFEHFITSCVKKHCKSFYGVSTECCKWLKHFNIEPDGILYNASDDKLIKKIISEKKFDFRKEYAIPQNATVITFVGRLVEEKGIISLINAFKKINKENAYLVAIGGGPLLDKVVEMKTDAFIPLGAVPFEKVIECLSESDVFCLPSVSEGFCTSVIEAIYCECVVCSTNVGGTSEVIENNTSGIIIDFPEENDVHVALEKVFSLSREEMEKMKKEALAGLVKCGCTFDSTASKIIGLFEGEEGKK